MRITTISLHSGFNRRIFLLCSIIFGLFVLFMKSAMVERKKSRILSATTQANEQELNRTLTTQEEISALRDEIYLKNVNVSDSDFALKFSRLCELEDPDVAGAGGQQWPLIPRKCPCWPPELVGNISVDLTPMNMSEDLPPTRGDAGGVWVPAGCVARQRVVVVVAATRDRAGHVRALLEHLLPVLRRQQVEHVAVVVEPLDETAMPMFNKALLWNIAFLEARRLFAPDCVVFHDADQLPEHDYHMYRCPTNGRPLHLDSRPSQYRYKLMYKTLIGGALAVTPQVYTSINGMSNLFYGWGKEDDELMRRFQAVKMPIYRHPPSISKYTSISHKRDGEYKNPYNGYLLKKHSSSHRHKEDGISTLHYAVHSITVKPLYTHILVQPKTPFLNYTRVKEYGACPESLHSLYTSIADCATTCSNFTMCNAFAYSIKATEVNCFLKTFICKDSPVDKMVKYFEKIPD